MLRTLASRVGADPDYPARVADLTVLRQVLDGTIYDVLRHEFHEERTDGGEYIQVAQRRPSVRYNLCRLVVADSLALLFGEGRFPAIGCKDEAARTALADVLQESRLPEMIADAAFRGSIGSVVVLMRILRGRVFFDVMDTLFLTPEWDPEAPDTLLRVTERYKVRGDALKAQGYPIADDDLATQFWFSRRWDAASETWFLPLKLADELEGKQPKVDAARTVRHNLGFVPMVWIRNLPGGDGIDGQCTFRPAIETQIEIEYQLSQAGRGLKYSSDPTLLIKEPTSDGPVIRSAANALVVDKEGDAKLLEINGTAAEAVLGYARALRELALESIHGNRSNADRVSASQSGRALEMLHQPLIWLADKLRTSYGENGLLPLLRMVAAARRRMPLQVMGEPMPEMPAKLRLSLVWPPWFARTEADRGAQASTMGNLVDHGLISRETAVAILSPEYDQPDAAVEMQRIAADQIAEDARAATRGAQVKAVETLPA